MDIKLSAEQARNLLRLVYLGNWIANAERIGSAEDPLIAEFDDLQRRLFAQAEVPVAAIEEDALIEKLIDEYREEVFWDEIVERLAHRDFERLWGLCPDHDELTPEMRREYERIEGRYEMELEESGIDRLELLRTVDDVLGEEFPGPDEGRE